MFTTNQLFIYNTPGFFSDKTYYERLKKQAEKGSSWKLTRDNLPDQAIRSVQSFRKRLPACIKVQGRHFEHTIN